jgi:hypothetical protein
MDPLERINDPEDAQRTALAGLQARIRTAMPGIVTAVDLGRQVLSVQPAIQGQQDSPDGTTANVNLPLLVDVPICWPRAGGFAITFPIAPGDEVLVVFGDRCIDAWWQSGGVGVALEQRMHDLSDAFAIPGPSSQPRKLAGVSATAMQMRNDAGTAYIEITPAGFVNIVSGALTHNGKNIGATHTHVGVATGIGTSGVPT